MKTLMMAGAAAVTLAASAGLADAQDHHRSKVRFEFLPKQRHEVRRTETVLVGYRDEIVGYRDVWVERPVTVYETRTVYRQVIVGYDHCRRPIYACRPVCEQVPVCRTERVCEKQPICEKRPVYETREVDCHEQPRTPWGISFLFGR